MEHYLDNAATTRTCPEAAAAALRVMTEIYGNPSSTHAMGREAKKILEDSRRQVASAMGAKAPEEVVFTSCGTESDNWAILQGAESMKRKGRHIISSRSEHDAVRRPLQTLESQGFEITVLTPDKTGKIHPEQVLDALREDTILVSLMMVNNETGAWTDIHAISEILKKSHSQALLHTDAVQAFRKVSFRADQLGADLISVSGHKIHAVKGIGALYIRSGTKLPSMILGGSQESGRRAGTEPLPQIAAFGAACAQDAQVEKMSALKKQTIEMLTHRIPELQFLNTEAPHILSLSMPGWRSEVLMNFLESRNIYVSRSSACRQGKRSHALEAIGLAPAWIDGALRVGFSRYTTQEDIEALTDRLYEARSLAHRNIR